MRVHGYCTSCRRIKRVTVASSHLASSMMRGTPEGVCDDCEEAEAPRRR